MEDDAQSALFVLLVTPALVDCGDLAVFVGEYDPAHPHGDITLDEAGRSLGLDLAPAFQAEAPIERVFLGVAHKIGQRAIASWPKGLLAARHGWLEENGAQVVTVGSI